MIPGLQSQGFNQAGAGAVNARAAGSDIISRLINQILQHQDMMSREKIARMQEQGASSRASAQNLTEGYLNDSRLQAGKEQSALDRGLQREIIGSENARASMANDFNMAQLEQSVQAQNQNADLAIMQLMNEIDRLNQEDRKFDVNVGLENERLGIDRDRNRITEEGNQLDFQSAMARAMQEGSNKPGFIDPVITRFGEAFDLGLQEGETGKVDDKPTSLTSEEQIYRDQGRTKAGLFQALAKIEDAQNPNWFSNFMGFNTPEISPDEIDSIFSSIPSESLRQELSGGLSYGANKPFRVSSLFGGNNMTLNNPDELKQMLLDYYNRIQAPNPYGQR